jgi:hypothetical protein
MPIASHTSRPIVQLVSNHIMSLNSVHHSPRWLHSPLDIDSPQHTFVCKQGWESGMWEGTVTRSHSKLCHSFLYHQQLVMHDQGDEMRLTVHFVDVVAGSARAPAMKRVMMEVENFMIDSEARMDGQCRVV